MTQSPYSFVSTRLLHWQRRIRLDCAGATAIEFAFVLPVLMAFFLGIVDVGRALWIQNSLQYATDSAARCASYDATLCSTDIAIKQFASRQVVQYSIATSHFTVTRPACGIRVAVSYQFNSSFSRLFRFAPNLTASSCHP